MSQSPVKSTRIARGHYLKEPVGETPIKVRRDLAEIETDAQKRQRYEMEREAEIIRLQTALTASRKDAEERERTAFDLGEQSGFHKGHQAGLEEGIASAKPAIAEVQRLAMQLESGVHLVWDDCRDKMTDLILDICRRIVGSAAENYHDIARELTERTVKMTRDATRITVAVNPADVKSLRDNRLALASLTEGARAIEIVERASVPPGGVIIETNAGQLDARLDEQMQAVAATLQPKWSAPLPAEENTPEDAAPSSKPAIPSQ